MIGFININKEKEFTSQDVVSIVKGVLKARYKKKFKVGHLGTLDPLATGVLPIAIGDSCKLFDYFLRKEKEYITTVVFGATSVTLDMQSEIEVFDPEYIIDEKKLKETLKKFTSEIIQTPPKYSAVWVDGKRAYDLARNNKDFSIKERKVTVHSIDILNINKNEVKLSIKCQAGTYIRQLALDIAKDMGSISYLKDLIRIASGKFLINNSVTLSDFKLNPDKYLLALEDYIDYKELFLNDELFKRIINGRSGNYSIEDGEYICKFNEGYIILNAQNKVLRSTNILWSEK